MVSGTVWQFLQLRVDQLAFHFPEKNIMCQTLVVHYDGNCKSEVTDQLCLAKMLILFSSYFNISCRNCFPTLVPVYITLCHPLCLNAEQFPLSVNVTVSLNVQKELHESINPLVLLPLQVLCLHLVVEAANGKVHVLHISDLCIYLYLQVGVRLST